MDHAPPRHADRPGRCGRSSARVDSAYRWLRRTDRNGSVIRWWVCGRTGETVVAMQWRSPKSFRRSRARRVVIWSKAIQTVVGFVVGVFVAASVGLIASPPVARAPAVPPVTVAMAVELVPQSTGSVPVTTPGPSGTPTPSPTADPTPRADTKRAPDPQQGPAPKPKPKPSPRPSPTETPAPPTDRAPSPTPDPTSMIAPTPTPSPKPDRTPKPPKRDKPPKPPH